jgi:hypothetical protein
MPTARDFERINNVDENTTELMVSNFTTPLESFEKSYRHSHRKNQLLYVKSGI